jgi:hypothetical protein
MLFIMLLCGECVERWIVCTPLSVNVFVTLATQCFLNTLCVCVCMYVRVYVYILNLGDKIKEYQRN